MKVLIVSAEDGTTSSGSKFLRLVVAKDDRVPRKATMFDKIRDPEEIRGKVCEIVMKEQEGYNPKVTSLKVLDGESPSEYMKTSKLNQEEALAFLKTSTRGNKTLAKVTDLVLFDNKPVLTRFKEWPAAKEKHHAFKGGLLEHTYCMAVLAKSLLENDHAYIGIDKDLLMTAVVLHDIGKVVEYDWSSPSSCSRSERGAMLGHIVLGDEMVVRACMRISVLSTTEPVLFLRHCILSHHGKMEWGSPVEPSIREAVALHYVDMIQSRSQMALEATESLDMGAAEYSKDFKVEFRRWR